MRYKRYVDMFDYKYCHLRTKMVCVYKNLENLETVRNEKQNPDRKYEFLKLEYKIKDYILFFFYLRLFITLV